MINYNLNSDFIVVTFIKMKDLPSLKKAISAFPRGIDIISYLDIYNKLAKKDDSINEPSEALISTCIIKQLNELLYENNTTHICYILDTTDNDVVYRLNNIMEFIKEKSERPIFFELLSDEDIIINKTKKLIKSIKI